MSLLSLALGLLPTALLMVVLVRGVYPGEAAIQRLRARPARPKRVGSETLPARFQPRRARRRWGQLISEALAGRGPPPPGRIAMAID